MASNPNPTRKYICDLRNDATDESMIVPAIQSVFPTLNISAIENHFADPMIPVGRVRCTIFNVSPELHDEIMALPGVRVFG